MNFFEAIQVGQKIDARKTAWVLAIFFCVASVSRPVAKWFGSQLMASAQAEGKSAAQPLNAATAKLLASHAPPAPPPAAAPAPSPATNSTSAYTVPNLGAPHSGRGQGGK